MPSSILWISPRRVKQKDVQRPSCLLTKASGNFNLNLKTGGEPKTNPALNRNVQRDEGR